MSRKPFMIVSFIMLIIFASCVSAGIFVEKDMETIDQYETQFIQFDLNKPFENPYDPDDIRVDAVIVKPNNDTLILPCFYKSGDAANSTWEARFTPSIVGEYNISIQVISRKGTEIASEYCFMVKKSNKNGFLNMNDSSYYSLLFDSGKRFRGVGLNICWENTSEWPYTYETYFDTLAKYNSNFIRIWMCPWNLPLEWSRVVYYKGFVDEFENWDKTYSHTPGIKLLKGKTSHSEDDLNRIAFSGDAPESIVYNLPNIKRFKMKIFFNDSFAQQYIRFYGSSDNIAYSPIRFEYSQTLYSVEKWQRIFAVRISDLPDSVNFLKIEFAKQITGTPEISNIMIEYGEPTDILDAPGLGRYYKKTANRFDEILQMAKENNVYIMLAHDYHGMFKDYVDVWASNAEWRNCPYSVEKGGPCKTPSEFFTNPAAKQFYKNKLRYMVARWGYSPNLTMWEFWNEIDHVMDWQNVPAKIIADWHREMSDYLREIDPYKHIITSSVAFRDIPGLWEVENLDITQHHNYSPTENMYSSILDYEQRFNKPDVVGEFGLSWKGPDIDFPLEKYEEEMHKGLWRGMFSPTPILPLPWWWEWHLKAKDYFHFKAASNFVEKMLLNNKEKLEEIQISTGQDSLEMMALTVGDEIFVWMLNNSKNPIILDSISVDTNLFESYSLKIFNTITGKFSENMKIESEKGILRLNPVVIKSGKDVAIWLVPGKH